MRGLKVDIIFPWEFGLILLIFGIFLIIIGIKQSKKTMDDLDKIPITRPTTKIVFGFFLCFFGLIQMIPLLM